MKFWKYIELDDRINHGLTENGLPFWEKEIHGWNDNDTYSDLVNLVIVRAIELDSDSEIEMTADYTREDLKQDLMIDKLVDEAKSDLQTAASDFRQSN
ncbi:hypothetical protein QWY16_09720 [Planococcus shenhongbingii]|uniref:Phage protein n=1 Tax=Planococcus shenhongbingii TaxID=3058398 RepID=A0ABT8NCF9_9BACL|nr:MULTISPECIES: hypothetical protein [unclassified Planococcus (in: firmicutes)]MDN7245541.1 hypothetical protein [Planococcus sp. N017]WKA60361.1 hypothetical protein QWY16_09720 [Planococcus sp. N016]